MLIQMSAENRKKYMSYPTFGFNFIDILLFDKPI